MGQREVTLGQQRLENWANWSLSGNARTGYPKASAFARMYRPDAGDTWEGIEPDETRAPIDDADAERVERFVRRLPLANRQCVLAFYIAREAVVTAHKRFGLSRQRFYALLDEAAAWCHDEGLQFDRS